MQQHFQTCRPLTWCGARHRVGQTEIHHNSVVPIKFQQPRRGNRVLNREPRM